MSTATTQHDVSAALEIARALELLHGFHNQPWEVRSPRFPRPSQTASGYYTDRNKCAREVAQALDGKASGVYVTLNPVATALLARRANRLDMHAASTTQDNQIVRRYWLPLDVDAAPVAGVSTTEAEHAAALARAQEVAGFLSEQYGWPQPVSADSGNGGHLLYRIDLPTDDGGLVARVLAALDSLFSDGEGIEPRVRVDTSVANPARIWKLYPTWAKKGDSIPERPHRRSGLLDVPESLDVVSREQLETVAALAPKTDTHDGGAHRDSGIPDLGVWLAEHGVEVRGAKDRDYGRVWTLRACVWNADHTDGAAWVAQRPGGALMAGCRHNGCQGKGWRDFRETVEPGYRANAVRQDRQQQQERQEQSRHDQHEHSTSTPPKQEPAWDEPISLPTDLPPVMQLDPAMLPDAVRPWVLDIAERQQSPVDFSSVGALVAAGALIGRRVGIHPRRQDDWLVVPNLYGAVVGGPSAMKSPALGEVRKVLDWLAAKASGDYAERMKKYEAKAAFAAVKAKALLDEAKKAAKEGNDDEAERLTAEAASLVPEKPTLCRYTTNDPTVEKLGEILLDNPNGVLVFRDELTGWLRTLDKQGHESDRAFYLEAWNGIGRYTVDRIARGTLEIPALCLSILGGIQPGPLARYILDATSGDSAGNDGLLQRFQLIVWPDIPRTFRNIDRWPDKEAKDRAYGMYRQLAALTPLQCGVTEPYDPDQGSIPALRFDSDAQDIFDEWRTTLENRVRADEMVPAFAAHLTKYRKLMPSLALIFHLMDIVTGASDPGPVTSAAALRSMAWCEYLESHANRVYSSAVNASGERAQALLRRIQRGDVAEGMTVRDIYRKQWATLATKEDVDDALHVLEGYGWVRVVEVPTDGRSSYALRLHPCLTSKKEPNA